MYYQQAFIKNLQNYRKVNHLTQKELAEVLNYSPKSIDNWEKGLAMPPIDILIELAHRMKMSLDQLLGQDKVTIYEQTCHYISKKHHNDKKPLTPFMNDRLVSYIFKTFVFGFSKHPELHQGNLANHALYNIYRDEVIKFLEQNHYLTTTPKLKFGPQIFDECIDRYEAYLKNVIYDTTNAMQDKTLPRDTRHAKKAELVNLKKQLADLPAIQNTYHKHK